MKKNRSCFWIIIIIIIGFFINHISYSVKAGKMPFITQVLNVIYIPINATGEVCSNTYNTIAIYFQNKEELTKRVKELEEEKKRLKSENYMLKNMAYQSLDLEKQLMFKKSNSYDSVATRVLYYSPTHWFKNAQIDTGYKDGVKKGFGVANDKGLIGQVIAVGKISSTISYITDEESVIGAMVQRSRVRSIAIGDGTDILILTYLKADADIRKGDTIVTSGDGKLIPSGVPIGEVTNIVVDKLTDSKIATIVPFVRFDNIDHIFVLKFKSSNIENTKDTGEPIL